MRPRISNSGKLLLLGGLAALVLRCESTELQAPADATMTLTAIPNQAVADEETGRARSTIRAEVRDVDGIPLEDVAVTFSAPSGSFRDNTCESGSCSEDGEGCGDDGDCTLASGAPRTVETNGSGIAEVPLVVTAEDDNTVVVTGSSGGKTATASVFNPLNVTNDAPVAAIDVSPDSPKFDPGGVSLFGTGSADPDGDVLTCYQWEINSSVPIEDPEVACASGSPFCTIIQGQTEDSPVLNYSNEQRLSVTLRVSDDADALPCPRSGPAVDRALLSSNSDQIEYFICDNAAPVAEPGSYGPFDLSDSGNSVQVQVNGSGSTDAETATNNLVYTWACGESGQNPTGRIANCTYTTSGNKTLRLTVEDVGNGQTECRRSHSETTVIAINP